MIHNVFILKILLSLITMRDKASTIKLLHLPVNCVSFCLCWVLNVGLIQQLLDAQQDLKPQSIILQSESSEFEGLLISTSITPLGST